MCASPDAVVTECARLHFLAVARDSTRFFDGWLMVRQGKMTVRRYC